MTQKSCLTVQQQCLERFSCEADIGKRGCLLNHTCAHASPYGDAVSGPQWQSCTQGEPRELVQVQAAPWQGVCRGPLLGGGGAAGIWLWLRAPPIAETPAKTAEVTMHAVMTLQTAHKQCRTA